MVRTLVAHEAGFRPLPGLRLREHCQLSNASHLNMMAPRAFAHRNAFNLVSSAGNPRVLGQVPYASCSTRSLKDYDLNALLLEMRCSNDTTNACADYSNTVTRERHALDIAETTAGKSSRSGCCIDPESLTDGHFDTPCRNRHRKASTCQHSSCESSLHSLSALSISPLWCE